MKATAELQVIPIGEGVSVREEVKKIVSIINNHDLITETHAAGTNIEGDMDVILDVVKEIHQMLHDQGVVRLMSYLKLETRTDKIPTLDGKKL